MELVLMYAVTKIGNKEKIKKIISISNWKH